MRIANIPGLALGVVRSGQVVYLKGYGIAGPDGTAWPGGSWFYADCWLGFQVCG
jgi:CubicO group peptidase (beta-lactamase class C family)